MTETLHHNGRTYIMNTRPDECMGAPWDEHDGHGDVSEWTTRDKRAGECVLNTDRQLRRFYDYAATIRKARAEGWGLGEPRLSEYAEKLGRAPTKREIVAESVRLDYEYLRRWCNDQWYWCGVIVKDEDGREASLWGVCSDDVDAIASELIEELECTHTEELKQTAINNRFRDAMVCGI